MLPFLYYCLKVIVCSGILYGYYLLALRNNRFHQWNRWYLLFAVVVSFTLPLLQLPLPYLESSKPVVVQSVRFITAPDRYFTIVQQEESFHLTLPIATIIFYTIITLSFLGLIIRSLHYIRKIKKEYPEEKVSNIHFYNTSEPGTPFSFFQNIFWNNSIALSTEKGQQMLRHEMAHVQQWHSADKVVIQLLIAAAWWNPFLYFIRKELSVIHEFIADQKASAGDDKLQYASLLLMKALGSPQFALGNPFFHSQLKRRISMLTTIKNPRFSYVRRLLVLPLAAISIILFSFKYKEVKDLEKREEQQKNIAATSSGSDDFLPDSTQHTFSVRLNKTYKGSAIASIFPATDMSGAVVKTADGKEYFLDRETARKELHFIVTDSGFIAPPNAILVMNQQEIGTAKGARVKYKILNGRPQLPFEVDTLVVNDIQTLFVNQNQKVHIANGSIKIGTDGNTNDVEKALIIVDGKAIDASKLQELDANTFESVDVLKGDSATARYSNKGKNGVVIITTKKALPELSLYILDGIESTKKAVEAVDPIDIKSVHVLKGDAAEKVYGNKGKNGVILITTKPAENVMTLPLNDHKPDLTEVVVTGYKTVPIKDTVVTGYPSPSLKEVLVKGYAMPKLKDTLTTINKLKPLEEVVVTGYAVPKNKNTVIAGQKMKPVKDTVVMGYPLKGHPGSKYQ